MKTLLTTFSHTYKYIHAWFSVSKYSTSINPFNPHKNLGNDYQTHLTDAETISQESRLRAQEQTGRNSYVTGWHNIRQEQLHWQIRTNKKSGISSITELSSGRGKKQASSRLQLCPTPTHLGDWEVNQHLPGKEGSLSPKLTNLGIY